MKNFQLIEKALLQEKGVLSPQGALMVKTGKSTGRSTKERFVVDHPELKTEIQWGKVNQPIAPERAQLFFDKASEYLDKNETFDMSAYVGCFSVSVKSLSPWHIAFAKNMFRDEVISSLKDQVNEDIEIKILHLPDVRPQDLGIEHEYEKAILLDPKEMKVVIMGTAYAGEIKKSAFTLCNFALPRFDILPMHSSANCKVDGTNSSVLFGLSGTGKTTLSADPGRHLIGDDEIVWSKKGLSNLEGGCYAKLINLSAEDEPEIYQAANKFGSVLENVYYDDSTRQIDFTDNRFTENTRASYPITSLNKVYNQNVEASTPNSVVFLTADAFGALPAVARLDKWQTQYHFISGYTAKVAGTEIGVTEPEATFSACFGAPFMPRSASVYAKLLAEFIDQQNVPVWILNTGWVKGYGKGDRFPISVSRQFLELIQSGELENVPMKTHPLFGFKVPESIPGMDPQWFEIPDGEHVANLAKKFQQNAEANKDAFTEEIIDNGGPRVLN